MRQALLLKLLTLTCVALALIAGLPGCEEPTDPSLEPPEVVESPTTAASAPSAATTAPMANTGDAPRTPAEYRKAAEAGDVPSMLLLGRSHESLGQTADARKWYQRAADAGNEDGKKALAALDVPPPPLSATQMPGAATMATTAPLETATTPRPAEPVAKRRPTTTLAPPADPSKIRWVDITHVLDYDDMIQETRLIEGGKRISGITTSRDKGIFVAAIGPNENDLTEVSMIVRVRNKVDPGSSSRVAQASALTTRITNDNVNAREFLEWVTQYLQNEQRSQPIFRNGWTISITGYKGEGKAQLDKYPHLGTAVMIEMKK